MLDEKILDDVFEVEEKVTIATTNNNATNGVLFNW